MGMRYPELSIVTRKRDLKERRDLVRRYLRAFVEAVRIMKTNREATLRVIEKYIHVGSKAEAVKTYDYFRQEHLGHAAHRARRDHRVSRDSGSDQAGGVEAQCQRVHR